MRACGALTAALLLLAAAPASASTLQTWTVQSRFVAQPAPLNVSVILPDGYNGTSRFPVLYLLHGHGGHLRFHDDDFVAARKAGVDVTYRPQQGTHAWPYWRRHLGKAIEWGFFKPVPETPRSWSYTTVAQRSEAWGLRFSFASPPESLETFSLDGRRLSATGSGTVRVLGTGFESFTVKLPFTRALPTKP